MDAGGLGRPPGRRELYRWEEPNETFIGGTVADDTIVTSIQSPGRYLLVADGAPGPTAASLGAISITPRVFAPLGGFANSEVAIGFSVSTTTSVTIDVYNRAGRLVRRVCSGLPVGAGANVVKWDGLDESGKVVSADLYVVSVQAEGRKSIQTLGVVR